MTKYSYSATSLTRLNQADPRLISVFSTVIDIIDTTIICGARTKTDQDIAFYAGKSKVEWPHSKHNRFPSLAIDAIAWADPLPWNDRERASYFAGIVMGVAHSQDVHLRWGGDWDQDNDLADNKFDDLWHFELED